jgi:protein SCO1/2
VGGPLDLVDAQGRRFTLDRLQGRPALLFFGFTRCSSTCPVAMVSARQVYALAAGREPTLVFITLDPLSDGPREVGAYARAIDPRMIGLTGTPQQVAHAVEAYGVGLRSARVGVEHSSMWYLLDATGKVRSVYPHDTSAHELARDLDALTHLSLDHAQ